jgi:hypothetical protein
MVSQNSLTPTPLQKRGNWRIKAKIMGCLKANDLRLLRLVLPDFLPQGDIEGAVIFLYLRFFNLITANASI